MKRLYIKPDVIILNTNMESPLLEVSGQIIEGDAKKHNFGFWEDDEEKEPSFPLKKNLWDD